MDKTLAQELAHEARERWREDAQPPSEEVLHKLRSAARKGYPWVLLRLDELSPAHLHWLALEGLGLQKLRPMPGDATKPGAWRVTWVNLPAVLNPEA